MTEVISWGFRFWFSKPVPGENCGTAKRKADRKNNIVCLMTWIFLLILTCFADHIERVRKTFSRAVTNRGFIYEEVSQTGILSRSQGIKPAGPEAWIFNLSFMILRIVLMKRFHRLEYWAGPEAKAGGAINKNFMKSFVIFFLSNIWRYYNEKIP